MAGLVQRETRLEVATSCLCCSLFSSENISFPNSYCQVLTKNEASVIGEVLMILDLKRVDLDWFKGRNFSL